MVNLYVKCIADCCISDGLLGFDESQFTKYNPHNCLKYTTCILLGNGHTVAHTHNTLDPTN